MAATDEDYIFTCEHCSTPFRYFAQYKSHGSNCAYSPSTSRKTKTTTTTLDYNCSYCKGRFGDFADFLSHFQKKSRTKSCLDSQKTRLGSNDVCVCVLCGFSTKRSNLLDHFQAEHEKFCKNRQIYQFCPMCSDPASKIPGRFSSWMDFLHHVSTFHPAAIFLTKKSLEEEKQNSQDKLVNCPSCEMYFFDNELEQHVQDSHRGEYSKFEEKTPNSNSVDLKNVTKKRRKSYSDVENDEKIVKRILLESCQNRRPLYDLLVEQSPAIRHRTSCVRRRLAEQEIFRSILRENSQKNSAKNAADGFLTENSNRNSKIGPYNSVWTKNAAVEKLNRQRPPPPLKCSFCGAEFKSKTTLNAHREIIHPSTFPPDEGAATSNYRWMLTYFYRQLSQGLRSDLRQFEERRRANERTTKTALAAKAFSRQAAAAGPSFSSLADESLIRQRANGRPVAVEYPPPPPPHPFDQQQEHWRMENLNFIRRRSNEFAANFAKTTTTLCTTQAKTPPQPTTTLRSLGITPQPQPTTTPRPLGITSPQPTTPLRTQRKTPPPQTQLQGKTQPQGGRFVVVRRSSSGLPAGITVAAASAAAATQKFRILPPGTTTSRFVTLGDKRKFLIRNPNNSSNQISLSATDRTPAASTGSVIISKNCNGKILLNVSKSLTTATATKNGKIVDDITIE